MRRQTDAVFELRMEMTRAQASHLGQFSHTDTPREVLGDTTQFEVVELDQYVAPEPARAPAPPARRLWFNAAI